eukprot:TRINITY_DN6675_c0_g1_i4.p1 TRINITY_DN6675_c0_g1~~TRINITY_DN6675_c0_g1_i4.p1  ORF type:complete len:169 (+),score=32.68 TRINITY_DN6675_c0_g1_i4:48-554(+)
MYRSSGINAEYGSHVMLLLLIISCTFGIHYCTHLFFTPPPPNHLDLSSIRSGESIDVPLSSPSPLHVVSGFGLASFDVGWEFGDRVYEMCKRHGRKVPKGGCAILQEVVEEAWETTGRQIADAQEKTYQEIEVNANKKEYRDAAVCFFSLFGKIMPSRMKCTNTSLHK